jgi:hypothetical protein
MWALADSGWKISPSKCIFITYRFKFLGIDHDTNQKKMYIDTERIGNIARWRVPKSYQEVGSRLAMLNWMKRFIVLLKTEAFPLHLMVVRKEFEWKAIHEREWENVKLLAILSVQLSYPDYNKPFVWGNDTSLFATGGWLSNLEPDGELTLVAINDKILTGEERRRAPVARKAAGVLINGRDFHPLLLQNTKGTHLLGDFMCLHPSV